MARYADIDVLLEHLAKNDEGDFRTAITQWLEMHQVEDVAPVVHAFWFWTDDSKQRKELQCSNCGKFVKNHENLTYLEFTETFQYCPKCGAKMDAIYLTVRLEGG